MASGTDFSNISSSAIRYPSYGSEGSSISAMTTSSYAHDMCEHTRRQMEAAHRSSHRRHGEVRGVNSMATLQKEESIGSTSSLDSQSS